MNPYTSTVDRRDPRRRAAGVPPRAARQRPHRRRWPTQVGRQALRCIRCSACLNVCPVYERTGGHAYGSVYPGPIGAILTPQLHRHRRRADASLPFASSLCGACFDVCPVRIDIPRARAPARDARRDDAASHRLPTAERAAMAAAAWMMRRPAAAAAPSGSPARRARSRPPGRIDRLPLAGC